MILKDKNNNRNMRITFDYAPDDYFLKDTNQWDFSETTLTDEDLKELSKLNHVVRSLNLTNTDITNEGLTYLKDFKNLNFLTLTKTKVTNIESLKDLQLYNLDIYDTKIEDFSKLPHSLIDLELSKVGLSDKDLEHVGKLPKLKRLYISYNSITNEGLNYLKDLKLHSLSIENTTVSNLDMLDTSELINLYARGTDIISINLPEDAHIVI